MSFAGIVVGNSFTVGQQLGIAVAALAVVVDNAYGLQMAVDDDRPHILESALAEVGGNAVGESVARYPPLLMRRIDDRLAAGETPYITVEGSKFLLYGRESTGVGDHGVDFPWRSDHILRSGYTLFVGGRESGDSGSVETGKALSKDLPTPEHHQPRQTARHRLHEQIHEVVTVVVDGGAPFVVVIGNVQQI